jgi:hypothetical protein
MAPEIFDVVNGQKSDPKMHDAWGAGIVLYYMYEKKLPFTDEDLLRLREGNGKDIQLIFSQ